MAAFGGVYARIVNEMRGPELVGLVDLHVHPAAHLGFGRELFFGAPDGDPAQALSNCNQFHGGFGFFDNPHGNELRRILVDKLQAQGGVPGWDHKREGWPRFPAWPSWHDRLHQQARWEWLERAWRGGLRCIVALAVNSHTLADGAETKGPYDDRSAADAQIQALREMASAHDFMRIVETSSQFRQAVRDNKLAVVLGVEIDCIGNFYSPFNRHHSGADYVPNPTPEQVRAEVDRLHRLGVRYVFPIHITDNVFGGAAVYERGFDAANRYQFGSWFNVEAAPAESGIGYIHGLGGFFDTVAQSLTLGFSLSEGRIGPPGSRTGHRNVRGLQQLGRVLIEALMDRGMLIDIDHMSERTVAETLPIVGARRYPICAGHNGVRGPGGSERAHSAAVAQRLYESGGSWGLGLGNSIEAMASAYRRLRQIVPDAVAGIGSDCCGLDHLPRPRFEGLSGRDAHQRAEAGMVVYRDTPSAPDNALERCRFGERTWDYSLEGMSHIGLLPDMLEEIVASRLLSDDEVRALFRSAERFASTWETCELRAQRRL